MKQKKLFQTILGVVVSTGLVYAATMDPNTRMEKVKGLFTQYGADTFKILNGEDLGGTGTSESGKSQQLSNRADIENVIAPNDGNSFVFCVSDGKWAVYPPEPMKIGADAMTATVTTQGKRGKQSETEFVPLLISALRDSAGAGKAQVNYSIRTPGGLEKRVATVWNSRNLLSRKNDTGKKFFCGTSIKAAS
jgi:hypothetical protein